MASYADAVRGHATEPQPRANRFVGCATVAEERALPTSDDPDEVLLHYRNRDATWFRCGPMEWDTFTTKLPVLVNVYQTRECADPELYAKMAPRDGWHEPNPALRFSTPQPEQILKWEDRQLLYVWRLAATEERRLNVLVTGGHLDEVPYNLFGNDDRDHAAFVKHWGTMLYQCYDSYRKDSDQYQCRYRP